MYDQSRKPAYGGNNSYGGQQQQQQGGAQRPAGGSGGGGGGRATIPLRPVTIRMILDSQRVGEGAMTISNHEVGIVSVVGRILEVANAGGDLSGVGTAKNHTYRITDGTGILTVKHWLDTAAAIEPQAVGGFIVATGSVKIYQEKPVLSGTIRTVTDQNEVVYHLLDSINVHLRMIHGDRTPAGGKPKADASSPNRGVPPPAATVPLAYGGGAYNAPVDNTANINATLYRVLVAANHNAVSAMDLLNGARSSGGGPGVTMQHVTAYLNEMTQNGTLNADGKGGYFL